MTAFNRLFLGSTLTLCFAFLVACGGGSNNNSTPPGPTNPIGGEGDGEEEEEAVSSLTVKVDNLQGTLLVDWQAQQFTLDQSNPVSEFSSSNNSVSEITITSPAFQSCEILSSAEEGLAQTVEIFCNTPSTHFLEVSIDNLKGELALTWGGTEAFTFIQNQPSLSIRSTSADVEQPVIAAQPNLQTCTGEFESAREINARYNIVCADAESEHIVEVTTDIPFPVYLRGTTNIVEVVDRTPVTMVGSQIDGISVAGTQGTQFCQLEKQAFSEVIEKQRWQLACREYTVHIAPEKGVVLTFDDRQEHILQPGDYGDITIAPVSRYNRQLVLSKTFGVKEILLEEQQVIWQDLQDQPENTELIDYLNTRTSTYLLYRDTETEQHSVRQLEDNFERSSPVIISSAMDEAEDQVVYSAALVAVSFKGNEIAYTEITGTENEALKQRRIVGIAEGLPIREFTTAVVNDNSFMVGGSHNNDEAPFIFQINDTNPLLSAENRIDMFILGQTPNEPIIGGLDTQLNIINWPDQQNQLRVWAMGKNLLQNNQETHLAELDIIQVGSGPRQIVWREISTNSNLNYDSMGSDGKLFVINARDEDIGHRVVSMFNQQGPVNLQALSDNSGMSTSIRTQRRAIPLLLPDETALSRTEVTPVNGWVLLYAGEDNSAGELWISNGEAANTFKVRDISWDVFQGYQLKFAGAYMAVLVSDEGEVQVFDFKP